MIQFSVVIPTFNRAQLVRSSIDSVLAQTHPATEIVVVNDGSSDNTLEVLATYGNKIRVVSQPNGGLSAARNAGIRAATCDWIAFLDDDDEYTPQRLAIAAESIQKHPNASVHATNTSMVSETGEELDLFAVRGMKAGILMPANRTVAWALRGCFFAQSLVIRRQTLFDVGLFRKTFYEDMDLLVRLIPRTPWIVDERTALRLIRRGEARPNLSAVWRSQPVERCEALVRIHREALATPGLDDGEARLVRTGLGGYLFELGCAQLEAGNREAAKAALRDASNVAPSLGSKFKAMAVGVGGKTALGWLHRLKRNQTRVVR